MQEAQATMEERNALRQLNPTSADYESQLFKLNPQLGIAFRKEASAAAASKAQQLSHQTTAARTKQEIIGQAFRDFSSRPDNENVISHMRDILESPLFDANEKAAVQARTDQILKIPFEERQSFLAQQGAKAGELKPTVQSVNQYGQTQLLRVPAFSGTPTSVGTYADVPLPADVEAQRARLANAGASRQTTNVNTQIPASEEAQKEYMKEARVTFNTLNTAPSVLANMEEAKKLVPSAKGFMGPGGEPMLKAASFLNNRLGTNIATEGITDATVLRSRLFTGVIENLRKLDAQPTQSQQQVLQDAIGNLGTDPNALPRVLDAFGDILREKVGSYNSEVKDAESRGVKFPYNPVIKMPEAKKPAADQIPGQNATGGNIVSLPDGRTMSFPNAAAAAQFKKAAGL
jgi:hypothetical protein